MLDSNQDQRVVTRLDGIVVENLDDSLCLFNPQTSEALVLNGTASDIWTLVDGQTSVAEIVEVLSRAYRADGDVIAKDVAPLLIDLIDRGFVRLQSTDD